MMLWIGVGRVGVVGVANRTYPSSIDPLIVHIYSYVCYLIPFSDS